MSFLENEVIDPLYRCASTPLEALNASPLFYVESEENARCLAPPLFLEAKMADPISRMEGARLDDFRPRNPHLIDSFRLKTGERIYLSDLEKHGLSYVPCDYDSPAVDRFAHLWNRREQVTLASYGETETDHHVFKQMQGVQIMTGQPTFLPSETSPSGHLYLMDLDIENLLKIAYPDHYQRLIETIYTLHGDRTSCRIGTKSDGDRFSVYAPGFSRKVAYHDKTSGKMLFEFFSKNGLSRLDNRYSLISGSLFDIPQFHTPQDINPLTEAICEILEEIGYRQQSRSTRDAEVVETSQIGKLDIQWVETTIEKDDGTRYDALVSQNFPTENCHETKHGSNRKEVSFTKFQNGSILGHCFNCGKNWWEFKSDEARSDVIDKNQVRVPYQPTPENITALLANAPPVDVREEPSFRHFSKEERTVVRDVLQTSPDAGWHGSTPIWTPKYEYLHPLTNKFALNGQPSEVEKRRVWSTLFGTCGKCGGITAKWIDRYFLTAGYYCDGCHKDYPLGSYLDIELNRKLPNSIISAFQGYLGENPDFVDFRLFEPGTLTHLGAGMGTGKTTEIVSNLVSLAAQGLGKGILVVPRIALAWQLAYQLRWQHGHDAWGLWTEGSGKSNKFIGTFGAIVCLLSLPQAVDAAEEWGVEQLYIAVDELDFGYELLSLDVQRAPAVKKILRDALKTTGLAVAGQTESTLALEAFAQELGCEQVQGFYNTAEPAEGNVTLKQHTIETNINAFLANGIDDISELLKNGQHVYAFSASRRDTALIAEEFRAENPLVYNAYTRGEPRCQELLRYQRLTDSRLFIGTSAAGVGISFLDKKATTVILNGLLFGSRQASMAVQKAIRDRGRRGILMHYKPYNFPLPVRPTENRDVSLYHEFLKMSQSEFADLPTHAISKLAYAQALANLADIQIETFVAHHLGTIGNMDIVQTAVGEPPEEIVKGIQLRRAEIRQIENELKIENAKAILKSVLDEDTDTELLTASEIRRYRNQARLSMDVALSHELANQAARAVGWDDTVDRFQEGDPFEGIFATEDMEVALSLAERNFDFDELTKKRAGYLAVNAPKWTAHRFELEVERANPQLSLDGLGIEITAVKDYRFLGEILKALLDATVGTVFETEDLATAVNTVLKTKRKSAGVATSGKTFLQELVSGALGASEYRKARFLHCADDDRIVDWLARFVSEWYPARLSKKGEHYALQPDTHSQLYLKSFERWLLHQPDVPDTAQIQLDIFEPIEMLDEKEAIARERRQSGATLQEIADELDRGFATVQRWCEGVTPIKKKKTQREKAKERKEQRQKRDAEILRRYAAGEKQCDIATEMGISQGAVSKILAPAKS